jgi:hypothetical protein
MGDSDAGTHDPLCPSFLADCANGRLLAQPPVVGHEPVDPKGKSLRRSVGPADVFL